VRLRDIPAEKLREIRRFVLQSKGKLTYQQMAEEIKKRWGYELTPGQLYHLSKEYKEVKLSKEVVDFLEREFGDVGEGLKQVLALARFMATPPPREYEKAVRSLAGQLLSYEEAVAKLRELGYRDPDKVLRELSREGFLHNERGLLRFYRVRRPPEIAFLQFLEGYTLKTRKNS
jgi:hypothetical protein